MENKSLSIGEAIKKHRKEKNMTQADLAEATGLSLTSIAKYEQGSRVPKTLALLKLNEVLDLGQDFPTLSQTQNPEVKELTILPEIKKLLSDKTFKLLPEEKIDELNQKIDGCLDNLEHLPGLTAIAYTEDEEIAITHEVFDAIMKHHEKDCIFDILKIVTCYLTLNYDGEKLLLDMCDAIINNQTLQRKNPYDERPFDFTRFDEKSKEYYGQ